MIDAQLDNGDDEWTTFGFRNLPFMSARERVSEVPAIQGLIDGLLADYRAALREPLRGVTTAGSLAQRAPSSVRPLDTKPIVGAAQQFLGALEGEDRARANPALEEEQRRAWLNVHMNFFRHGVMLETLDQRQRAAAFDVIRATLSARGFSQARNIMRLNELVAQITGDSEQYGEHLYFFTVFGTPSATEPWAWQLDGHHLNINCAVLGDQMVMTPTFMGSEPCNVQSGPYAGTEVLAREELAGLDLINSLGAAQREMAVLHSSIMPGALPGHLEHWIDGRMQAGAFKDNVVLPYQGLPGSLLEPHQRTLLMSAIGEYLGWARPDHARVRGEEVQQHLDDTWFSWMGGSAEQEPFYYRIHSPVVLIEFDHHPGIVFANDKPTRHHIHTIIRTPNGGDYGADLLAEHYKAHHHSHPEGHS